MERRRLRRILVEDGLAGVTRRDLFDVRNNLYAQTVLANSEIQRPAPSLPAQERIQLVVEFSGQSGARGDSSPDWQRHQIRDRLAALEAVPLEQRSAPWEAVRKQVFAEKT